MADEAQGTVTASSPEYVKPPGGLLGEAESQSQLKDTGMNRKDPLWRQRAGRQLVERAGNLTW